MLNANGGFMKKTMLKIFATASAIIAIVFVIVLLVAVFGGITVEEFDNALVKGLFVTLGSIYVLIMAFVLTMLFINDETVKEIVLRSDKEGGTRTTVGVVRKITKDTVALVEGVKCTKSAIIVNEYGVRLKIAVTVKGRDIEEIESYLRALLEDAFMGALNFKFYSIEIKVKKLEPKHKVNAEAIMAEADAKREEARLEEQAKEDAENAEEISVEAAPVEEVEVAEEAAEVAEETPEEASAEGGEAPEEEAEEAEQTAEEAEEAEEAAAEESEVKSEEEQK